MKALLLIDLQNDFMPRGALAVPEGYNSIVAANIAQKFFNVVIASKDWHPEGHISFASCHQGRKVFDQIDVSGFLQTLWPDHCLQHTHGASFVKELNQDRIEHVVYKGEDPKLDSYSAFFDNAHRYETGLAHYLKQRFVDELYILGIALEYCVKFTAIDAMKLGLKTNVIIDGCAGIGLQKTDMDFAKTEMLDFGVNLVTLDDVANDY